PGRGCAVMVWRRAGWVFRHTVLLLLPFLSLPFVLNACGAVTVPVTHRPASSLHLQIHIANQYQGQTSDQAKVYVTVKVFDGTNANGVSLADKAHLTCNGNDIKYPPPATVAGAGPCPRQPPGGSYKFTYTDEHGASTTATVPVSADAFSILS